MPEGTTVVVDLGFIDSVVDFCKKQETFNEQMLALLREARNLLIDHEKRIQVLEREVAQNATVHYGPNGKSGLH